MLIMYQYSVVIIYANFKVLLKKTKTKFSFILEKLQSEIKFHKLRSEIKFHRAE